MTTIVDTPSNGVVHIVVADDEVHILDLVATIVEDQGYRAIRAANGESALHAVLEYHPALVLTDVMMPHLRGDELCQRLKADPATSSIPVVLITSLPTGNFNHSGAAAYIAKPFDIQQIEDVVKRLLS